MLKEKTQKGTWAFVEGYWGKTPSDSELPWPQENESPWEGQAAFLEALEKVEAALVPVSYRGHSNCRLCGENLGNKEYQTDDYIWPKGLHHYIEKHNVKPSENFIEYILGLKVKNVYFYRGGLMYSTIEKA